jgi:hypothetical protein
MIEPNTPASIRVRAAECVLNHAMNGIEIEDVEARVSQLKRDAAESKSGRGFWLGTGAATIIHC